MTKKKEKKQRRIFTGLATLAMVASLAVGGISVWKTNQKAKAAETVDYYDPVTGTTKSITEYTLVENNTGADDVTWDAGWYVVEGSITVSPRIKASGDINIILKDGSTFTASAGMELTAGRADTLTVYSGPGTNAGNFIIPNQQDKYRNGIMADASDSIIFNGGTIEIHGDWNQRAAIGNGLGNKGGSLTINGGNVSLVGENSGAIEMNTTTLNAGSLYVEGGSGCQRIVKGSFTMNGGSFEGKSKVISSDSGYTSYPVFQTPPVYPDGYMMYWDVSISGSTPGDAKQQKRYFDIDDSIYEQYTYIQLVPCTSHEKDSVYSSQCTYCGMSYLDNIEVTIPELLPGMEFPDSASCETKGVLTTTPTITWTMDTGMGAGVSSPVGARVECNTPYYAKMTLMYDGSCVEGPSIDVSVNSDATNVSTQPITGGIEVTYFYEALDGYDVELSFGDEEFEKNYIFGDTNTYSFVAKPFYRTEAGTPVELTIPEAKNIKYEVVPPMTVTGAVTCASIDETTGELSILGAGDFCVQATLESSSYFGQTVYTTETFHISEKDLTGKADITVVGGQTKPYSGTTWEPTIMVKDGETVLEQDVDYSVAFADEMVYVGDKTVQIEYMGNYTGYDEITLSITRNYSVEIKNLANANSETGMVLDSTGGASSQMNLAGAMETVYYDAAEGYYFPESYVEDVTYSLVTASGSSVSNSLNTGIEVTRISASRIKISGTPELNVTVTLPPATEKEDWKVELIGIKAEYNYGATDVVASVFVDETEESASEISYNTTNPWVATVDVETGAVTIKNAGTFKIIVTVAEGKLHKATLIQSEEITVRAIDISEDAVAKFVGEDTYTYDGKKWEPEITVSLKDGTTLTLDDYEVIYPEDMISVGAKAITINFTGNYAGTIAISGEILEATTEEPTTEEPTTEEPTTEEPTTEEPPVVVPPVFHMPDIPFTVAGTKGENNYYNTEVVLTPTKGYLISDKADGEFANRLVLSEDVKDGFVYLYEIETKCVSDKIAISDMLIDAQIPTVFNVVNDMVYYCAERKIQISDKNLDVILINDEEIEFEENSVTLTLSSNDGFEDYVIVAKDKAGHEVTVSFTLSAEWMQSSTIPENTVVNLKKSKEYKFGGGTWKVSGDDTEYYGGSSFFIKTEGKYTFMKQ